MKIVKQKYRNTKNHLTKYDYCPSMSNIIVTLIKYVHSLQIDRIDKEPVIKR